MKLSIVIPCRVCNGNKMDQYCQHCLDSIQKSENIKPHYNDFEVILVDDCSEDDSLTKLNIESNLNFKYVRNSENLGIGGARNSGFDKSTGDYVWYIDADDVLSENWHKIFEHFEEDASNDVWIYFVAFETLFNYNEKTQQAQRVVNMLNTPSYVNFPVSASVKVTRRDKCIPFPEKTYLEDMCHHFKQIDIIDDDRNFRVLKDTTYWKYLNLRSDSYTSSVSFLQQNRFSFFQLITQDIMCQKNMKDKAISDLFRTLGNLYDLRHALKHDNVKEMCIERCLRIFDNVSTQKWSH